MSEKKTTNLTDFFKKENKKKPATKKDNASSEQTKTQTEIANEPNKEKLPKKDDYESSEEEKTDLIIGQDQANLIKDKKEIQAQKRKQQQEQDNSASGWGALEKPDEKTTYTVSSTTPQRSLLGAQPKGASTGGNAINFKSQPPTYSKGKKNEKLKLDEEFPELGGEIKPSQVTISTSEPTANEVSKKDNPNIGMFGASGARAREDIPAKPEEKKEATKPVFTSSKKKTLTGGDQVEAIQSSKQNYDFSSF